MEDQSTQSINMLVDQNNDNQDLRAGMDFTAQRAGHEDLSIGRRASSEHLSSNHTFSSLLMQSADGRNNIVVDLPLHWQTRLPVTLREWVPPEDLVHELGHPMDPSIGLPMLLAPFCFLMAHTIRDQVAPMLNSVLNFMDVRGFHYNFIPLRRHYLKFAFWQIHQIVLPMAEDMFDTQECVDTLINDAMDTWIMYSIRFEKLFVEMIDSLQKIVRSVPEQFDEQLKLGNISSMGAARSWMFRYLSDAIAPVRNAYENSQDGVGALKKLWDNELDDMKLMIQEYRPDCEAIMANMTSYQPSFYQMHFYIGEGQPSWNSPSSDYGLLWLPQPRELPQEDVALPIRGWVLRVPYDEVERYDRRLIVESDMRYRNRGASQVFA